MQKDVEKFTQVASLVGLLLLTYCWEFQKLSQGNLFKINSHYFQLISLFKAQDIVATPFMYS